MYHNTVVYVNNELPIAIIAFLGDKPKIDEVHMMN